MSDEKLPSQLGGTNFANVREPHDCETECRPQQHLHFSGEFGEPMRQLRRREFIQTSVGLAMSVWPLIARAQKPGHIPRVGIVWIAPQSVVAPFHDAFR